MGGNILWKFFGESRYLTPLQVFGIGGARSADSTITDLELGVDHNNQQIFEPGPNRSIDPVNQKLQEKITAALKLLSFREQHVLVQFWSPSVVGKHQLLTTIDQPFGLGVVDVGLCTYRGDSECSSFLVDKDHEAEDQSPAARVFKRELPEWTFDLTSYTSKQFPQQACALSCGLHGYLGLPVFDSTTRLCVGVVEILTSSKYTSYAYEVQQLYNALEVPNEHRQKDFNKIYTILKTACVIHTLPLAQTWTVSELTNFVSHEKVLTKICSSFDSRCVGKVCMSRAALPFHVQDLSLWPFLKACRERHLDRSRGLVGQALVNRGSYFCGDVTKLGEEEYPLVHNARMNRLTSCFAIFLHSVEAGDDYVLEFFLPPDIKETRHVLNLVQTLKQNIELDSGFELGDTSCIHVVEPPTEVGISLSIDPGTAQISLPATTNNNKLETVASDSESMVMVTVKATFRDDMIKFEFPTSSSLLELKNEVAQRIKLESRRLRLKYKDEDSDLILLASDDDLRFLLGFTANNSTIRLITLGVDPNNQQVFEPGANRLIDPDCQKLQERITAALKLLSFREQHVLVQFWSPSVVGKHQLLTTIDQPFGLGVVDVRLRTYRQDSECRSFLVDKDHEADDHSPTARVFRSELPEWTFDLTSYTPKQFPQQACALRCGLHGYLGLPVFDSTTRLCVGVVEVLMSSKYTSYAYEVQQLYKAFETVDLRTPQAFDWPTLNVSLDFNL
ncbi:hypothetical protein R6Q57_012538 [Mikania cordata]